VLPVGHSCVGSLAVSDSRAMLRGAFCNDREVAASQVFGKY
jgi:hypothetical protein